MSRLPQESPNIDVYVFGFPRFVYTLWICKRYESKFDLYIQNGVFKFGLKSNYKLGNRIGSFYVQCFGYVHITISDGN